MMVFSFERKPVITMFVESSGEKTVSQKIIKHLQFSRIMYKTLSLVLQRLYLKDISSVMWPGY